MTHSAFKTCNVREPDDEEQNQEAKTRDVSEAPIIEESDSKGKSVKGTEESICLKDGCNSRIIN